MAVDLDAVKAVLEGVTEFSEAYDQWALQRSGTSAEAMCFEYMHRLKAEMDDATAAARDLVPALAADLAATRAALAEAQGEVEKMAGLLRMMDAAIENSVNNLHGDLVFRMPDGWHSVASLRTSIRAVLALKGTTP